MIIVTGANGFIGSAMVWELNQAGFTDVIAVDTIGLSERDLLKKRKYSRFLLKDELWPFLDTKEAQDKVTWVIHMGACSSTTETNKEFLWENNTHYTQRIFEWCARHKKSLIYASSAATYGAGELGFDDMTDSEKLRPLNLYGESKVLFDRWAVKQKSSLTLFRSANPEYKDGEFMRDFVYVKDVTGWMMELMQKKPKNGVYNMGFGKPRTWLDLANGVFSALEKALKIDWIEMPENIRGQYQYFTEAKTDKWKAAGMSASKWPLEKATADYVQNYLSKEDPSL